jgi:hypothetical protein
MTKKYFTQENFHGISIIMIENGVVSFVGKDPANTDYQQYLAWLEAGNTPEPWEATNGPV